MIPNVQRININNLKSIDKLNNNKQTAQIIQKETSPKHSIPSLISSPPNTPKLKTPNQKSSSK